jgi:hypothetical protein
MVVEDAADMEAADARPTHAPLAMDMPLAVDAPLPVDAAAGHVEDAAAGAAADADADAVDADAATEAAAYPGAGACCGVKRQAPWPYGL